MWTGCTERVELKDFMGQRSAYGPQTTEITRPHIVVQSLPQGDYAQCLSDWPGIITPSHTHSGLVSHTCTLIGGKSYLQLKAKHSWKECESPAVFHATVSDRGRLVLRSDGVVLHAFLVEPWRLWAISQDVTVRLFVVNDSHLLLHQILAQYLLNLLTVILMLL